MDRFPQNWISIEIKFQLFVRWGFTPRGASRFRRGTCRWLFQPQITGDFHSSDLGSSFLYRFWRHVRNDFWLTFPSCPAVGMFWKRGMSRAEYSLFFFGLLLFRPAFLVKITQKDGGGRKSPTPPTTLFMHVRIDLRNRISAVYIRFGFEIDWINPFPIFTAFGACFLEGSSTQQILSRP